MPVKISEEDFVDAWLQASKEGQNMTWVSKKLGYKSRQAVSARAFYLRERGVVLPPLSRHNDGVKERLNEQVAKSFKEHS